MIKMINMYWLYRNYRNVLFSKKAFKTHVE